MSFHEVLQHRGDFFLEWQVVRPDDPGSQALEAGVVEGVDLALVDRLEEVQRSLEIAVASVDVGAVVQQEIHDLEFKQFNSDYFFQ